MADLRFVLQHYDGPVVDIYDQARSIREGNPVDGLVEIATRLLGGTPPADTDAAIQDLVTAGYRISIGDDRTTKFA